MDLSILKQVIEELIPFNKLLGIQAERVEQGSIRLALPWRDEFIGNPMKRAVHGGVISALADVAGGMAVWSALAEPMSRVSTIDLRVDYLRPGKPDALIAESKVLRIGGRMGVSDITIFHAGAEGDP